MKRFLSLSMFLCLTISLFAQREMIDVNSGNRKYNKKKYVQAELDYRKGLDKNPKSFSANFDLGNALFRQEKYEDAANQYAKALNFVGNDKIKAAHVYHNIGNSLLKAGKVQESIEAYKNALRNNPKDDETRYNLAFAKRLLQQQQQQQQQQNQNQDQQDPKQDENRDKNKDSSQPQPQSGKMSQEEAEQILQALQQDERETQDKVKKQKAGARRRVEKDW